MRKTTLIILMILTDLTGCMHESKDKNAQKKKERRNNQGSLKEETYRGIEKGLII
ncbi:hypothetical protein LC065_18260 [Halobacillus litoralis]|uniref:hypothetical protein n=1 Tax=Halobacillus litoralis TaxID=45668 RepID=UPI001CFEAF0E|nr:hypothetical protein [Halobacillus litoralis]WLR47432.1 hypothetical protein LC065_18260 [Halobacillus litoralis]